MQLKLRNLVVALAMMASAGSCGEDEVVRDEWMLGLFSSPSPGTPSVTYVQQLEIRPDGTARWIGVGDCDEDAWRDEAEYVWRLENTNTVVITDAAGGKIEGFSALHITREAECDQIRVAHVLDGEELHAYLMHRGEVCLFPTSECDVHGCTGCVVGWCDGPPEPCE